MSQSKNTASDLLDQSNKFLRQKKEKSDQRKNLISQSLGLRPPRSKSSSGGSFDCLESEYDSKNKRRLKRKENEFRSGKRQSIDCEPNELPSLTALIANTNEDTLDDIGEDLSYKEENDIPKNDYCQHFVDTGSRPQNFIRDPGLMDRFEEYPKLRELIRLKDELIERTNMPSYPVYLKCDLINLAPDGINRLNGDYNLNEHLGGSEFDVVLIEPPLHEYQRTNGVHFDRYFSWDDIKALNIEAIASQRSFVFLWCGSADGLDKGRECLKKWGFRRCEDICWIKTNKKAPLHNRNLEAGSIFQRAKEHCLMGIRGTVRRSTDNDYIHTNVDIDLIITEEPEYGLPDKPREIFHIIEHFCLGRRRLYLFGRDSTIRPGWLTVGPDITSSNFDKLKFKNMFDGGQNSHLCGTSDRIEMLRPKTPPLKAAKQLQQMQQHQQQQQQFQQIAQMTPQQPQTQIIPDNNNIMSTDNNIHILDTDTNSMMINAQQQQLINPQSDQNNSGNNQYIDFSNQPQMQQQQPKF